MTTNNAAKTIGTGATVNNHLDGKKDQTEVNGNLYVDGNVYINGTLDYVSSNSAATTVFGDTGTSILPNAPYNTSGETYIVMNGTNGAHESMAAMTQVEPGKRFSMGAGTGLYHGESSLAVGGSARIGKNTIVKGGLSFSLTRNDDPAANAGVSYSW